MAETGRKREPQASERAGRDYSLCACPDWVPLDLRLLSRISVQLKKELYFLPLADHLAGSTTLINENQFGTHNNQFLRSQLRAASIPAIIHSRMHTPHTQKILKQSRLRRTPAKQRLAPHRLPQPNPNHALTRNGRPAQKQTVAQRRMQILRSKHRPAARYPYASPCSQSCSR